MLVEGDQLNITRVSRLHMGAYLCIARNGILPAVSKRVDVKVHCEWNGTLSLGYSTSTRYW